MQVRVIGAVIAGGNGFTMMFTKDDLAEGPMGVPDNINGKGIAFLGNVELKTKQHIRFVEFDGSQTNQDHTAFQQDKATCQLDFRNVGVSTVHIKYNNGALSVIFAPNHKPGKECFHVQTDLDQHKLMIGGEGGKYPDAVDIMKMELFDLDAKEGAHAKEASQEDMETVKRYEQEMKEELLEFQPDAIVDDPESLDGKNDAPLRASGGSDGKANQAAIVALETKMQQVLDAIDKMPSDDTQGTLNKIVAMEQKMAKEMEALKSEILKDTVDHIYVESTNRCISSGDRESFE